MEIKACVRFVAVKGGRIYVYFTCPKCRWEHGRYRVGHKSKSILCGNCGLSNAVYLRNVGTPKADFECGSKRSLAPHCGGVNITTGSLEACPTGDNRARVVVALAWVDLK